MKTFLSKFMDAAEVAKIEEAFKAKNPDSTGLPIYIPKTRFDEVDNKRKAAEDALKAVPTDWQEQLNALNEKLNSQKSDYETKLQNQKNDYEAKLTSAASTAERTAKVYGSGARNVKAVLALLDESKPVDEQLSALQKSDPYLFNGSSGPKGTGKGDGEHGGDGDDKGTDNRLSTADMYRAVGLTPPTK